MPRTPVAYGSCSRDELGRVRVHGSIHRGLLLSSEEAIHQQHTVAGEVVLTVPTGTFTAWLISVPSLSAGSSRALSLQDPLPIAASLGSQSGGSMFCYSEGVGRVRSTFPDLEPETGHTLLGYLGGVVTASMSRVDPEASCQPRARGEISPEDDCSPRGVRIRRSR